MSTKNKSIVTGAYSAEKYTIFVNGTEHYSAGNAPLDSQTYVSAEQGVGLATMKEYCERTARQYADEVGGTYGGIELAEEDVEDLGEGFEDDEEESDDTVLNSISTSIDELNDLADQVRTYNPALSQRLSDAIDLLQQQVGKL